MVSRMATVFFCFALVGSTCFAGYDEYDFEDAMLSTDAKNFCLKMAVKYSQPDQVEEMLAAGADATLIDFEGRQFFIGWMKHMKIIPC